MLRFEELPLELNFFFIQLWKSYTATLTSGQMVGIMLGFITIWALFALMCHSVLSWRRKRRNVQRAGRMEQTERDEYYDELICDGITNAIEDAVAKEELKREEATMLYSELAQRLKTIRLIPQQYKGPMSLYLVERAKHIMKNRMRKLNAFKAPVIPGDAPPPITVVAAPEPVRSKRKPRNALEAAMMPSA